MLFRSGTFYPANEVWLFWEFLRSLPPRERISGAGEVFKTMWIRGRAWKRNALITYVQSGRVESGLDPLILDCLRVKSNIVARDPLDEKRIREILNFGHTIGHALESASRGRMSHGESVLWGMLFEAGLLGMEGRKMGILCGSVIRELNLKLPEALGKIPESDWRNLLSEDKKNRGKKIELSLLSSPGRIRKKTLPPEHLVKAITQAIASILQK